MYTLGINAVYHDSSATLVRDGVVIAAAEDERFTHVKHAKRPVPFSTWELPFHAIDYCLREAAINLSDVDHVAYSYEPALILNGTNKEQMIGLPLRPTVGEAGSSTSPWDPLFLCHILNASGQLADGAPHHLQARFTKTTEEGRLKWRYVEHHLAHAASAYYTSGTRDKQLIVTIDGVGDGVSVGLWRGENGKIDRLETWPNCDADSM
jgi:carbamoyltransferase